MRGYLLIMVLAIMLPVGAFAGVLFWRYADSEIARIDQQLENDARELALDVDRDLQAKIVTLETLATANSMENRDYARFYDRATRVKDLAGVDISLRARDGQQLANTRVPWGTPLPRNLFQNDDEAASTGKPYISNAVEGLVAGNPIYLISLPISDNGKVNYLLHMTVDLAQLGDLVRSDIVPGEIAGILDRDNVVMARTEGSSERTGKPASKSFIDQVKSDRGTWLGQNIQGYQIRLGYARSKLSGWLVWVGVPDADIQNPLHRALWRLSALGAALTIIALGLVYWLGGRLAGASRTLAAQASALGRGEAVLPARIPVRELDEVGHELVAAAARRSELERQLVRTATQESEQRFQTLVHGVTDYAIYMLDPQGHVTNWNTGAMRIKGYSESDIVGRHFSVFYTPEDRADGVPARALLTAINEGRYEAEGWRVRKDGTRFWASVVIDRIEDSNGELIGLAKITRDTTERREAQQRLEAAREQLYQSQKMDAVGQLTGGVAHDFNNLLTIIIGNLDNAKRTIETGQDGAKDRLRRAVDMALVGANRAATLTGHLLAFSRRQPLEPKLLDINRLLNQLSAFLKPSLGEAVQLEVVGAGGVWAVEADAVQLETAILNLAVNARDAMPRGGRLTIEASNVLLDDSYCADNAEVRPGQYVLIAVTDEGVGMDEETATRAFEPFFTTKQTGQGTGLGLSQVYGYVKQSGGHVKIYSEPGQGTTVRIYLPRARDGKKKSGENPVQSVALPSAYGRETILVVEDDADVRAFICETLEELKYTVLQARDADSALRALEREGKVDLLLSDVILPGPNGRELASAALTKRPGLKVLFMTGYSRNAIVHQGRLDEGVQLIQKPLTQATLAAKVRAVLDLPPIAPG
ncbi:MAG: PAS domain S-box protein [Xanthobacteraceae bacterium]